jgi:lipid A disaccharide synthetase
MTKKRKATFTKQTAAQNKAMIRRAKELLKDADLNVLKSHTDVMETIQNEFPDVKEYRILARMAQALGQLRYEKYFITE